MSTLRFYKKASPKQPVYVGGNPILFEKINIELGIYKTDDEGIQREFAALQQRSVGGIFDISADEYAKLLEKKTTNSQGSYRDEFSMARDPQKTLQPDNDLVSHVEENSPVAPSEETPPEAPTSAVKPAAKPLPRQRNKAT